MIQALIKALGVGIIIFMAMVSAFAQADEKCRGPIYSVKDVANRAKITQPADLSVFYQVFGNDIQGHAVVDAVLCRSGRVTDIAAVDIDPPKIMQFVVAAVSQIEFKPAERNFHTVSQKIRFEFLINESRPSPIDVNKAAGRLIEDLDVVGYQRLTSQEIMTWIKSRAGEVFDNDQIQRDLRAILATGNFVAQSTRVLMEDAPRGGVRLIFEVHELPLLNKFQFERPKESEQSDIFAELRKQNVGLERRAPLDPAKLKRRQLIQQSFVARGSREVTTEALVKETSTEVIIIFRINGYRFP